MIMNSEIPLISVTMRAGGVYSYDQTAKFRLVGCVLLVESRLVYVKTEEEAFFVDVALVSKMGVKEVDDD